MKRFIALFFLIVCFVIKAHGQIEFVKESDSHYENLEAISQITDNEGNTYILSRVNIFHNDNFGYCGGGYIHGYTMLLYKIDASGNVAWKKRISDDAGYAKQMFISDSLIFIPFGIVGSCVVKQLGGPGVMEGNADIAAGSFINSSAGEIIKTSAFSYKGDIDISKGAYYYDDSFTDYHLLCIAMHKDKSISYLFYSESYKSNPGIYKLLLIDRDDTLGCIRKTDCGTIKYPFGNNVVFDEASDEYVVANGPVLFVYNRDWSLLHKMSLPNWEKLGSPSFNIACNGRYYVVNYGSDINTGDYQNFTAVFTKKGKLISVGESVHYNVLTISSNNIIYSVPQAKRFAMSDSIAKPVAITAMDIHQNAVREKHIGMPYVIANSISFTDNGELVVTGTSATTISQKLPKTPDGIYYYKEKMVK